MRQTLLKKIQQHLQRWQNDERGAVALLMLATMMVTFMLGLVIFDAGYIAEDKLEAQIAADTASWSQSSVEARAMNTIAFANVGKRITVGIISFYEALWVSIAIIFAIVVALAIACWIVWAIAMIFGGAGSALTQVCTTLTEMGAELGLMMAEESKDLVELSNNLMKKNSGYFQKDAEAFTKYQDYMNSVAPWWSWGEGFVRGFRNGAVTTSWPVPGTASGGGFGGLSLGGSSIRDSLPIVKAPNKNRASDNLCNRIYANSDGDSVSGGKQGITASTFVSDIGLHTLDYFIKSLIDDDGAADDEVSTGAGYKIVTDYDRKLFLGLMGLMAIGFLKVTCPYNMKDGGGLSLPVMPDSFGSGAWPYMIRDTSSGVSNKKIWLRWTSNLTFAYRQGQDRGDDKYEAMLAFAGNQNQGMLDGITSELQDATQGVWTMSRSEISYQYMENDPDLWHPSWVARMRPVSLPGEWQGAGANVSQAFGDALPLMMRGAALQALVGGSFSLDIVADGLRMKLATESMKNGSNMDGVAK